MKWTTAFTALAFFVLGDSAWSQVLYKVTDLGGYGGTTHSVATAINNRGQVVGYSGGAFVHSGNGPLNPATDDLGTMGGSNVVPKSINNLGQIVGYYNDKFGKLHGFVHLGIGSLNQVTDDLGLFPTPFPDDLFSEAVGINDLGQVVGYSGRSVFVHTGNGPLNPEKDNLGAIGSQPVSSAINNRGDILGNTNRIAGNVFMHSGSGQLDAATDDLGRAFNGPTAALDINDNRQIVGLYRLNNNLARAFIYNGSGKLATGAVDLGTIIPGGQSVATSINNNGRVVGLGYDSQGGQQHAFIYDGPGPIRNLADLVDPAYSGLNLRTAESINDRQQIVGSLSNGSSYLATPIPQSWKQGDPLWGGDTLINSPSGNLMKGYGCIVTNVAMLLNSFGHNIDPKSFNNYLRQSFPNTGDFVWGAYPSLVGQANGVGGPPVRFSSVDILSGSRSAIIAQIQQKIDTYGSVLLKVPSEFSGPATYTTDGRVHYVLAYDVIGSVGNQTVLIRDPAGANSTLDQYVAFENGKFSQAPLDANLAWLTKLGGALKYAEVTTIASRAKGYAHGHSPIDFLITDALGRRLGHDPVTGMLYNEIPESFYGRDQELAAGEGEVELPPSGFSHVDAELGELAPGTYSVQVFGLGSGPWSIDFDLNDPTNRLSFGTEVLSGIAAAGSYQEFSLNVVQVPEPAAIVIALLAIAGCCSFRGWQRVCLSRRRNGT